MKALIKFIILFLLLIGGQLAQAQETDSLENRKALEEELQIVLEEEARLGMQDRFFFALVHDRMSTFGMTYGTINKKNIGLYFTARADAEIFKHGSYFTVDGNGDVSGDVNGNVRFTERTSTGNAEGVFGFTKKLIYPVWIYAGGGAAYNPVYWEAEASMGTGIYKQEKEWARNTDETSWAPVFDAGLIGDIKGINIRGGVKTHDFSEWFITVGVGFSVRR
ncbi:hypothetical protein ACFSRY_00190 [Pontibacter locisalis]|uniref:Outer membrane protein beta-barrel domain-containing protein n=1 Tax=Pontibacter locisalis TaxID=1719035 RepID=A0ABW5IF71_9BACT